jgi:hypothetical protein
MIAVRKKHARRGEIQDQVEEVTRILRWHGWSLFPSGSMSIGGDFVMSRVTRDLKFNEVESLTQSPIADAIFHDSGHAMQGRASHLDFNVGLKRTAPDLVASVQNHQDSGFHPVSTRYEQDFKHDL